jgi:hypothetical protein
MVFSDTTGKSGLIQLCENYTGLKDGAISGNATSLAQFTAFLNNAVQKTVSMIISSQGDWDFDDSANSDYPISTTPGTTNRDYSFPVSLKILKVKRVDASYDGSNTYQARPLDSASLPDTQVGNDAALDAFFSTGSPVYDLKSNALWLYPRFTQDQVDAGAFLRVEYVREVSGTFATTDTTKVAPIDSYFHPLIALLASYDWSIANLPNQLGILAPLIVDWEARLKEYYGKKQMEQAMSITANPVNYL